MYARIVIRNWKMRVTWYRILYFCFRKLLVDSGICRRYIINLLKLADWLTFNIQIKIIQVMWRCFLWICEAFIQLEMKRAVLWASFIKFFATSGSCCKRSRQLTYFSKPKHLGLRQIGSRKNEPRHEKICLAVNLINKGTDQLAHLRSDQHLCCSLSR